MYNKTYNVRHFSQLEAALNQFNLSGKIIPQDEVVEVYDHFGHRVVKHFSEVFLGKTGCDWCVRRIHDHFEQLRIAA